MLYQLPPNAGSIAIALSGTWSGTVQFVGSTDGSVWNSLAVTSLSGGVGVTSSTVNGAWTVGASGLADVCVYASAYSSGTIAVNASVTTGAQNATTINSLNGMSSQTLTRIASASQPTFGQKNPVSTAAATIVLNTASTITNTLVYPTAPGGVPDTAHFTFEGCNPVQAGPSSPKSTAVVNSAFSDPGSAIINSACTYETIVDSSQFEYYVVGTSGSQRISIDGVEMMNAANPVIFGTATAGSGTTITLQSGASSVNGTYNTQYIYLKSGTGAGQQRLITGYVGGTLVATVSPAWTTNPDATSTYGVNSSSYILTGTGAFFGGLQGNNSTQYYMLFTFGGVRAQRRVKIECVNFCEGIGVDSSGSLTAPAQQTVSTLWVLGDSYCNGQGTSVLTYQFFNGYANFLGRTLGMQPWYDCGGGTGIVANHSSAASTYAQRVVPPVNSWSINNNLLTGQGTFTITQGGVTTGSFATNASAATIQTALNSAFGASTWYIITRPNYGYTLYGLGANATNTAALTVTPSGQTGAFTVAQNLGDLAPNVPRDLNGNLVPFTILVQGSINDIGQSGLQAATTSLLQSLQASYPQATIFMGGLPMTSGPLGVPNTTDNAYLNGTAAVPGITFIPLFSEATGAGYINGATNIGSPSGASGVNTDVYIYNDGSHPTLAGHPYLAQQYAQAILKAIQPN